jgi:hypothetical protein
MESSSFKTRVRGRGRGSRLGEAGGSRNGAGRAIPKRVPIGSLGKVHPLRADWAAESDRRCFLGVEMSERVGRCFACKGSWSARRDGGGQASGSSVGTQWPSASHVTGSRRRGVVAAVCVVVASAAVVV